MAGRAKASLTTGKILPQLIRLTIPMMVGMVGMVVFNLADTFFIGQLGAEQLAAMGFTFPVVMVLISISVGLGMGTSAVISREIGKGSFKNVRHLATNSLLLGFPVVAIFALAGSLTIEPLFRLLGAEGATLSYIKEYMQIWYIGVPFVVIPMIGNNIIRATGDMKTPGMIMVAIAGLNIILDPLLIFGLGPFPEMGIAGGALATVFSRAVGMTIALVILAKREKIIRFAIPKARELIESWKKILYIGIPAGLARLVIPLSMGVVTRFVSEYGNSAVAGFGVACRLEALAMMLLMALSSVLIPFTGQNTGAGQKDRVLKALKISYIFSLAWGGFMFVLFLLTGKFMAGLFNDDPSIVATVVLYLNMVSISYGFQGLMVVSSAALNGSHKPIHSAVLSMSRMFVFYIPLALIGSKLFDLKGIFMAGSIANFGAGLLSLFFVYRQIVQKRTKQVL
ncbi:MAG: MATE family efflux transporter [Candidatus Sabulitectum sp.]|nr:MATE family efflux transporter [Candidatus Sabulitectum sp.]